MPDTPKEGWKSRWPRCFAKVTSDADCCGHTYLAEAVKIMN